MRCWELARYAIENAWRSRLRTVLTIVGIAIASGALVSMVGFVLGLRNQVEAPLQKLGMLNNIEVRPRRDDAAGNDTDDSPVLDDDMLKHIERIDGVDFLYPDFRLSEITLARDDDHSCSSYAVGIPREATLVSFTRELLVAGRLFSLNDEMEVLLGEKLVAELGFDSPQAAVGQPVRLMARGLVNTAAQQFELQKEELVLTVVGVYRSPGFATDFGRNSVLMPVDIMRKMPMAWMEENLRRLRSRDGELARGYPQVIVRAERPTDVMRVAERIRELGFATQSVLERVAEMRRFFVFMEVLLTAVGTVALVVAGLGILNTLLMTVMERCQEIGVYKSIGASNGDIRWMFLVEAAVVGCLGGIAGLGLARVVSWILGWAFNSYAHSQGVEGPMAVFVFPWWLLVGAVAYAVLTSVVSGLYPASRAANLDPIEALRRN